MSVSVISTTQASLGYGSQIEDPREPIGQWFKNQAATGDGSGGTVSIALSFSKKEIYSIEGVRMTSNGADSSFSLRWDPGWLAGTVPLLALEMITSTLTNSGWQPKGNEMEQFPHSWPTKTGIFPLLTAEINNTAGRLYSFHTWGYRWALSAMRQPGGPRRPRSGR